MVDTSSRFLESFLSQPPQTETSFWVRQKSFCIQQIQEPPPPSSSSSSSPLPSLLPPRADSLSLSLSLLHTRSLSGRMGPDQQPHIRARLTASLLPGWKNGTFPAPLFCFGLRLADAADNHLIMTARNQYYSITFFSLPPCFFLLQLNTAIDRRLTSLHFGNVAIWKPAAAHTEESNNRF